MADPKVKTRRVVQKYITLRDPGKTWGTPGSAFFGEHKAQDLDISLHRLSEFMAYSDCYSRGSDRAFTEFDDAEERALSKQGWANYATRSGVWATVAFKTWFVTVDNDDET